jgi:predicted lipoprotein with Yx(FWY)xxD motif
MHASLEGTLVPEKRKLMVAGAVIAAAFALPGCAPAGYNAADYGNAAEPAADAGASPDPTSTADPVAQADPDATAPPGSDATTELPADQVTTALTGTTVARMGKVIENQDGHVLYRFDSDDNDPAAATCNGDCAKVWKPVLTNDGAPELKGIAESAVSTVDREDGTKQITIAGWPVYTYVGDIKAGSWKGQNVSGKWFVIQPTGAKNLTCLPKVSKPVAPPAADDSGSAGDAAGGGDYSY